MPQVCTICTKCGLEYPVTRDNTRVLYEGGEVIGASTICPHPQRDGTGKRCGHVRSLPKERFEKLSWIGKADPRIRTRSR